MPWETMKQGDKVCVVKKGEDKPISGGCHATQDEADKHLAALYANAGNEAKADLIALAQIVVESKVVAQGKPAFHLQCAKAIDLTTLSEADLRKMLDEKMKDPVMLAMMKGKDSAKMSADEMRKMLEKMTAAAKAITDAPNLRDRYSRACIACQFYQSIPFNESLTANGEATGEVQASLCSGMCTQYQFETKPDWVCDNFALLPPEDAQSQIADAVNNLVEALGAPNASAGKTAPLDDSYAVKFIGESQDEIENYEILWGTADSPDASRQKDFFTKATDTWRERLPLPRPLTHHHGFDPITQGDPVIGAICWEQPDDVGLKYRAKLRANDGYDSYVKRIPDFKAALIDEAKAANKPLTIDWDAWEKEQLQKARQYDDYVKQLMTRTRNLIKAGALKTSSDSVPQYVQREPQANGTNFVKVWPLVAAALTTQPAEPRMNSVTQFKAAYKSIGVDLQLPEAGVETPAASASPAATDGTHNAGTDPAHSQLPQGNSTSTEVDMDETKVAEIVAAQMKAQREADKQEAEAKALEAKKFADAVEVEAKARQDAFEKQYAIEHRKLPFAGKSGSHISVASKYDILTPEDLALLAVMRVEGKSIGRSHGPDEELLRALAVKSFALDEKPQRELRYMDGAFKSLDAQVAIKTMEDVEIKSNEVMQSTLASYGDEWVTTNFSNQLWLKLRAVSRLLAVLPQQEIPRGYESDTIPLEGTDFTFYNVSQAATEDSTMKTVPATITSSKMGTAQRAITVGKLGARGYVSGELDEDSIIDAIPEARRKLEAQLPEELDFVLFNADDTSATDNINGNGTPVSGADYTVFKGLIRLGLKTNTANAKDMGAAIDTTKINALYQLLGTDGQYVAEDPTKCVAFCDYQTWWKLQALSDLLTVANAGDNATVNRGALPDGGIPIFGVRWYPSVGVKKAQATGVRHGSEGSNTLGRGVLLRPDQWKLRWKRRMKFETMRDIDTDSTKVVATLRLGLGYFDSDAAAVGYNI